jgi:catechol 2,3-dioxygenase
MQQTKQLISRVAHVALRVPDMTRSVEHATQILGLREVERDNGTVYLTCNPAHHSLQLISSDRAACDHIAFKAVDMEALETIHDRLVHEGVHILSTHPEERGIHDALRFVGPSGHVFEIFVHVDEGQPNYIPVGVRPRQLGHLTIKCENVEEMVSFVQRVLGFRVSDRMAKDAYVWMRCNPYHHSLAVVKGQNQFHHYAWDVSSLGDIGQVADCLLATGKTVFWGPGRHGPGNNLFLYYIDPDGAVVEYTAGMTIILDEESYQPGDWSASPPTFNRWGAPSPEEQDFIGLGINLATPAAVS